MRKTLERIVIRNWRPKLICLLCAILVWLSVDFFLVRGDTDEWDMNEIRVTLPE